MHPTYIAARACLRNAQKVGFGQQLDPADRPASAPPTDDRGFDPEEDARLDRSAAASGVTRTALADRLLNEGLRRIRHPRIDFVDGPAGRRPFALGTGLDIWEIVATIRANNDSVEEAADYLQVPFTIVEAAARYHAEFADEIDRWIEANEVMAEREERLYRQQTARRA